MDPTEKTDLADQLALILSVQMSILGMRADGVTKIENSIGRINRKAIGYIYGFIDCALQHRGEDITDLDVGLPVLYHSIRKLFPGHEQSYIDFLMSHMEDEITVLGMLAGGQEYLDLIINDRAPFGLFKFIVQEPMSIDAPAV